MPETTTTPEPGSQTLSAEQALSFAQADAVKAYRDLSPYRICLAPVAEEVIPRMVLVYTFSAREYHEHNAEALHCVVDRF